MARRISSLLCALALVCALAAGPALAWRSGGQSAGQSAGDLAISAAIYRKLTRENPLEFTRIEVKTFDGVVVLGGLVDEYGKMQRVIEIARSVSGVTAVDNRMSVMDRD